MEVGFYHPDLGYWQGESNPKLPKGTLEVPLIPGPDTEWFWDGFKWNNPNNTPEGLLQQERLSMKCSRLQGRLVLGEATCNMIDNLAKDPNTPWAMRQTILNAIEWSRTSQAMTELGYLLGYTDEQMDDLFRIAMTVKV